MTGGATPARAAAPGPGFRVVGATLIDGTGDEPLRDTVVEVRGDRIAAVGRAGEVPATADLPTVDGRGLTVLPGLIDAHVHAAISMHTFAESGDAEGISDALLRSFVAHGVTAIRDPGNPDTGPFFERLKRGEPGWPRFFGAGPQLDGAPGVRWAGTRVLSDASDARAQVDDLADAGVDLVKVYHWITPDLARAVVEAAHARGLPVAYHPGLLSVGEAVGLGVDQIEHLLHAPEVLPPDLAELADGLADEGWDSLSMLRLWEHVDAWGQRATSLIAAMARHGATLTPTLALSRALSGGHVSDEAERMGVASMPAPVQERWERMAHRERDGTDDLARAPEILGRQLEFVRLARDAGVTVAAGTGGLGNFLVPGSSLHEELALLVDAGFTPVEAIAAATSVAARVLGRESEVGTVAVGRVADLVLVDGDPSSDVRHVSQVRAVLMGGEVVHGALPWSALSGFSRPVA